jgi:hypothetical protein
MRLEPGTRSPRSASEDAVDSRPAFYALAPGGWRDYATILHPPYTAWHLSYVVIGAALAPHLSVSGLVLTALAFFLAVGIGAHALDELHGRPLGTAIPTTVLIGMAAGSIAGAVAIGVLGAVTVSAWIWVFIGCGVFLVVAYNLELFGGRFHTDWWFALAWGAFPVLTGYFACAQALRVPAILAAGVAIATSLAQRRLSSHVRTIRRRAQTVQGEVSYVDGTCTPITKTSLTAPAEAALRAMTAAMILLAATILTARIA